MKIFERTKEYILPYLLTLFLSTSIFYIYDQRIFTVYNFFTAVIIAAVFWFLRFLKKHKVAGSFIYIVAAFTAFSLMLKFMFADDWGTGFSKWFLSAGEDAKFRRRYFYAFLSAFPFFFSTVVYYFSTELYRTSFLMLVSLVPCAVYVKVLSDMNDTYLLLIAGLNAALYAVNTGKRRISSGAHYGKKAYLLSIAVIVLSSVFISSLLPKQGEAIYYDKFEKYFLDAGDLNGEDYSALGKHSSDAGKFRKKSYTALYQVYSYNIMYFRRQCFDIYAPEEHCFYPLDKYNEIFYENVDEAIGERAGINLDDMLSAMKRGAELDSSLGKEHNDILLLEKAGEMISEAQIIPKNKHNANYLLTTLRTLSLESDLPEGTYGYTAHGQITSGKEKIASDKGSIRLTYYPEYNSRKTWLENGGADFTDESYLNYIDKLKNTLKNNGEFEYYETASAFEKEFSSAMEYKADYSFNNSDIPDDIAELAAEIIDGCEYDYQKAEALQEYFLSGEYTYDLEYIPPKGMNTVSYFVFTSKRGTCSDFAMAYTLMARSAGLTVRYTEGFAPSFKSGDNSYTIFEKDSHAYPEVYIQNTGWIVYDPTAASFEDYDVSIRTSAVPAGSDFDISIDTGLLLSVIRLICIVLAVAAAVIILVPSALKLYDNIRIRKNGADGILLAYRRLCASAERRLKISAKTCTPYEFSEEVYSKTGIDLSEFVEIYEKVCFGGISPDKEQNEFIYTTFRQTVKQLRKYKMK